MAPNELDRVCDQAILGVEGVDLHQSWHDHLKAVLLLEHGVEFAGGSEQGCKTGPQDGVVLAVKKQSSVYDVQKEEHATRPLILRLDARKEL